MRSAAGVTSCTYSTAAWLTGMCVTHVEQQHRHLVGTTGFTMPGRRGLTTSVPAEPEARVASATARSSMSAETRSWPAWPAWPAQARYSGESMNRRPTERASIPPWLSVWESMRPSRSAVEPSISRWRISSSRFVITRASTCSSSERSSVMRAVSDSV
jgi:hypothetical protein